MKIFKIYFAFAFATILFSGCASNEMRLRLDIYSDTNKLVGSNIASTVSPDDAKIEHITEFVPVLDKLGSQMDKLVEIDSSLGDIGKANIEIVNAEGGPQNELTSEFLLTSPSLTFTDEAYRVINQLNESVKSYKNTLLEHSAYKDDETYVNALIAQKKLTDLFGEFSEVFKTNANDQVLIPVRLRYETPKTQVDLIPNRVSINQVYDYYYFKNKFESTNKVIKEFSWIIPESEIKDGFLTLTITKMMPELLTINTNITAYISITNGLFTKQKIKYTASVGTVKKEETLVIDRPTNFVFLERKDFQLEFKEATLIPKEEEIKISESEIPRERINSNGIAYVNVILKTNINEYIIKSEFDTNRYTWTSEIDSLGLRRGSELKNHYSTITIADGVSAGFSKEMNDALDEFKRVISMGEVVREDIKKRITRVGGIDLDRMQDAADPMWHKITTNKANWNLAFSTNYFRAEGNSGVVVVRDSPIHYRIQRANNNPTALVQSQLRISRALTDAAIDIVGSVAGVKVDLPAKSDSGSATGTVVGQSEALTAARRRVELDEKLRIATKSIAEIEAELIRLQNVTDLVQLQTDLTNLLNGAAKRFEK